MQGITIYLHNEHSQQPCTTAAANEKVEAKIASHDCHQKTHYHSPEVHAKMAKHPSQNAKE